jgi:sugar lactone lactonase YvrE
MTMRTSSLGAALAAVVAALLLASPVLAGANPPGKTNACSSMDGSLAAETPGTQAFHDLAWQALQHGCVAYVTNKGWQTLGLEFVRGPLVGTTLTIGSEGATLTDLALTSSGALYGIDFSTLYRLNVDTGQATAVGPVGFFGVNGLVVGPDGTIYASGDTELLTIDPATGAGTPVGNTGFFSSGDLAFAQDGKLYMTAPGDRLVRVDPTTGAGTLVGPIGSFAVYGLVSSYGTLYAMADGGQLLTVDASTGAGTLVTGGEPEVWGAASLPSTT